jgi:uncharacterized iron-regulated membrane protein
MTKTTKPSGKKGKSWRAKLNAWLHLWLGLASGLIVFIVSITGCMFSFQKEISEWVHHDILFVQPQQQAVLPVSVLQENAQVALGKDKPVEYVTTYRQKDRAWEFMAYEAGDENALTWFGSMKHYESVFVNPYTGAVVGHHDYMKDFFAIVKMIHWSLLLNSKYGQPIVGWSVFIFVILLITGLILWWPKKWTKKAKEQSFQIKWSGSGKRVNYDLHNVLGFYAMSIALILALTGMVWSFKWFQATVYVVASRSVTPPSHPNGVSDTTVAFTGKGVDIAYADLVKRYPQATRIGLSPADTAQKAVIYMSAYFGKETYYNRDDFQFDKNTGKELVKVTSNDRNAGERLIGMNYDIHVGAIGGIIGKIIAFLISLICASLPVTGFLVWWNKRNKKEKYKVPKPVKAMEPVVV